MVKCIKFDGPLDSLQCWIKGRDLGSQKRREGRTGKGVTKGDR